MQRWTLAAVAVYFLSAPTASYAATILGVSFDGGVSRIDESDGSGSSIGDTGFSGVNSLSRRGDGTFFSVARALDDAAATLFTIDPSNGAGSSIASLDFGKADASVRGLAFSPSNALFAVNNGGSRFSSTDPDDLYTINVNNGLTSLVGNTGLPGIQALTFASDGTLYGWDVGTTGSNAKGLVVIDPLTGQAKDVNDSVGQPNGVDIQTLAFSPEGTLYGGRDVLYRIDPKTGQATLVGSGGYSDIRGFDFEPAAEGSIHGSAVPEPGTLLLFGIGVLAVSRRRSAVPS